jgi:hypothetical protein
MPKSERDTSVRAALLEETTPSDVELAHHARAARIAVTGSPDA